MASFYYFYGAMNSGKSFEILKVAHNYEEQGKRVLVLTSGVDDRDGIGKVSSRVGESREAMPIYTDTDIFNLIKTLGGDVHCVLIDESQFLEKQHIRQLANIVDLLNIPVMAYGLKNDFQNNLFEGSKNLLIYADKISEIKTICWYCEKKAIHNLRVNEFDEPEYDGEQVQIGGNDTYIPVCRKHYHYPVLESVLEFEEDKEEDEVPKEDLVSQEDVKEEQRRISLYKQREGLIPSNLEW